MPCKYYIADISTGANFNNTIYCRDFIDLSSSFYLLFVDTVNNVIINCNSIILLSVPKKKKKIAHYL